jgi:hypothetical protein
MAHHHQQRRLLVPLQDYFKESDLSVPAAEPGKRDCIALNTSVRYPLLAVVSSSISMECAQTLSVCRLERRPSFRSSVSLPLPLCLTPHWDVPVPMESKCDALAFFSTDGDGNGGSPLLLLTQPSSHSLMFMDADACSDLQYVMGRGWFQGAITAMAARGNIIAVHSAKSGDCGKVVLLELQSDGAWVHLRNIYMSSCGVLPFITTLSFSADGRQLACNGLQYSGIKYRACLMACTLDSGEFVRVLYSGLGTVRGTVLASLASCPSGWLVFDEVLQQVGLVSYDHMGGAAHASWLQVGEPFDCSSVVALVPGHGLILGSRSRLRIYQCSEDVAMETMSPCRLAWVCTAVRVCLQRN